MFATPELTLKALQNPDACLSDVDDDFATKYHVVLRNNKENKVNVASEGGGDGKSMTCHF
jgi:hypothetical protein